MNLFHPAAYHRTYAPVPAAAGKADADTAVGRAWLDALCADPATRTRIVRARSYARSTETTELSVSIGQHSFHYRASWQGQFGSLRCVFDEGEETWEERGRGAVSVTVDIPCMPPEQWREMTAIARALPRKWAQLSGAEITERLLTETERHGLSLLPSPHELYVTCGCSARSKVCRHAAAALLQAAQVLDRDPLVLLLLRGRAAMDFLAGVADPDHASLRRTFRAGAPVELPRVSADGAFARRHPSARPPLPPLPVPGPAASVKVALTPLPGVDVDALTLLAIRMAKRAGGVLADIVAEAGPDRWPAIGAPRAETSFEAVAEQAQRRLGSQSALPGR